MNTILYILGCPCEDWGVLYIVSSNVDKKLYEGHDWYSPAVDALAHEFGWTVRHGEFKSEDEVDGETPDQFQDIEGGIFFTDGTTT